MRWDMGRKMLWALAVAMMVWGMLPTSAQTVISNNAADMANHIVMVADSTTPRTVTNLFTFDRGAAAPFALGASSTKVTYLDADKLDGQDSTYYTNATNLASGTVADARLSSTVANVDATETITGAWTYSSAVPTFSVKPNINAGLQFPATQAASADANTLDDYEEGTFTLTDGSGAGLSITSVQTANYTKIGNRVCVDFAVTYPATANGSNASLTGLPVTVGANSTGLATGYGDQGSALTLLANTGAVTVFPYNVSGTRLTNANLSGKTIYGSGCYRV